MSRATVDMKMAPDGFSTTARAVQRLREKDNFTLNMLFVCLFSLLLRDT